MKNIEYIDNHKSIQNNKEFIAIISNVNSEDELFTKLKMSLKFPDYYNFDLNWNALYDCLRDLYWIDKKGIILIHTDLPKLDIHTFKIYLDVLFSAMNDWKEGEEHYLKIVFPKNSKDYINDLLM